MTRSPGTMPFTSLPTASTSPEHSRPSRAPVPPTAPCWWPRLTRRSARLRLDARTRISTSFGLGAGFSTSRISTPCSPTTAAFMSGLRWGGGGMRGSRWSLHDLALCGRCFGMRAARSMVRPCHEHRRSATRCPRIGSLTSYKSRRANMGAIPESDTASGPESNRCRQRRDRCRGEPRITNMRMIPLQALAVACAALMVAATPASAEDGVSADKIIFGQAAALYGPASALGQGMKLGLDAAFAEANKAGGVKGRKLELKSVDDGYEPTKSIEAVKKLLGDDKVFALAGSVGTPTAAATLPIATAAGAPFIGAFTGVESLREPYKPLVVNVRASYYEETEAMVEHLTKDLDATKIAIMYQDDAFGQAGLAGVKKALEKRKMELAAEGTFERNTTAVKSGLLAIKKADPHAIIMISPYKPAAEFFKLARQIKLDATIVNISFVGSDALAKELGNAGAGAVVTQVVPFPKDAAIPVVARYHAALKASVPD